jgi:hypothetical protein
MASSHKYSYPIFGGYIYFDKVEKLMKFLKEKCLDERPFKFVENDEFVLDYFCAKYLSIGCPYQVRVKCMVVGDDFEGAGFMAAESYQKHQHELEPNFDDGRHKELAFGDPNGDEETVFFPRPARSKF